MRTSEEGDAQRKAFKGWLEGQRYEDSISTLSWVEVQYGDERGETKLIADSDEYRRWERNEYSRTGQPTNKLYSQQSRSVGA